MPSTHGTTVPNVFRSEYTLLDITDEDYLSLMDEGGETREDLKMPERPEELVKSIREGFDAGDYAHPRRREVNGRGARHGLQEGHVLNGQFRPVPRVLNYAAAPALIFPSTRAAVGEPGRGDGAVDPRVALVGARAASRRARLCGVFHPAAAPRAGLVRGDAPRGGARDAATFMQRAALRFTFASSPAPCRPLPTKTPRTSPGRRAGAAPTGAARGTPSATWASPPRRAPRRAPRVI